MNSIAEIRNFLEEGARPLEQGEFVEFWKSLNEEDKAEFQHAKLSKN